jgi:hypothetical protein
VRRRILLRLCALALVAGGAGACTKSGTAAEVPRLAPRDTTMTTVKPTRQRLSNQVSLAGKVTVNPVFGLVAPVNGTVRYFDVRPGAEPATEPTRVATVWKGGRPHYVSIPTGAVFAGRLVEERATVTRGMPIVSARHSGYGIVAEIDGGQAYKISDSPSSVRVQIKGGPGPFSCRPLGTIAALPPGTIPEPPAEKSDEDPDEKSDRPRPPVQKEQTEPSEETGLRLVCKPPRRVKMINGATATVQVVTEKAVNALVLPVEAVAGSQGRGKVDVVGPDGTRETRDVVLGLTDGKVVQIRSGLKGDETVAVPGPNLPPAETGGEDRGKPGFPGLVREGPG